jgi:hypothetical protein
MEAMGFVSADTELIGQAATDLARIRSDLDEAMTSMAGPTTALVPAARDEISAAIATVFADVGTQFQAVQAQAAQFHNSFVNLMKTSAMAYTEAEVANAAAAAVPTGHLGALPAQIGGFVEGFLGGQLQGTGDLVADIGSTLADAGKLFSNNGAALTNFANSELANLMTGGLSLPVEGELLGASLGFGPAGFILQSLGSASQFIGNGLFQTGTSIFNAGASLIDAANATI